MKLDVLNFRKGFLIDDSWMAGVSDDPQQEGRFLAFVIDHATGDYVGAESFATANEAVSAINSLPRPWKYEGTAGCDGTKCAEGTCKKEGCRIYAPAGADLHGSC